MAGRLAARLANLNLSLVKLQQWRTASVNRGIFVAVAIVGFFTVISKLASMVKDLFVARSFGVSSQLDAFLVSFIVPSLIINLIGSSFNVSLIPVYVEVRTSQGKDAARELLRGASGRLILILLACTAVLAILGPEIISLIGNQFDVPTVHLAQALYFIALPSILISGLATIWSAILNAEDRFSLAAVAPTLVPAAMIIALIIAPPSWGAYTLGVGMLVGFIAQTAMIGYSLQRHGLSLMPRFFKPDPLVNGVLKQLFPAVTGGIFAYSTDLVDQTMAAMLGAGSVSVLTYGSKLTSFATGIAGIAISSAVLPYFSRLVADKNWGGVKRTYRIYGLLIFATAGAVAVLGFIFSEPLIRIFFQHGAFTASDTEVVAYVQKLGILEVPFYAVSILTVRLISALKGNHILAQAAILNGFVNITLNYLFMQWFGVAGIALSTTCVYVVALIFLFFSLQRRLRKAQAGEV